MQAVCTVPFPTMPCSVIVGIVLGRGVGGLDGSIPKQKLTWNKGAFLCGRGGNVPVRRVCFPPTGQRTSATPLLLFFCGDSGCFCGAGSTVEQQAFPDTAPS